MRLTTHSTERSFGYLALQQFNNKPSYPSVNGCSLVLTTSMLVGENALATIGKTEQDRLDSKSDSYLLGNKIDRVNSINITINHLRCFNCYTKL